MSRDIVIEMRHVAKIYKLGEVDVHALRDVTLKVRRGEFLAIMGKSGSGKSTCLYLMGCLDVPTRGKVIVEGRDTRNLSQAELAELRGNKIGFVFQQFNLIPTLNVWENIELPLIFQGVSPLERKMKVRKLIREMGLEHRVLHTPHQLSGGEQQRVAIARALVNDPEIILADEPTGNLDTRTGSQVIKLLRRINREKNTTVIVVTHDRDLASRADRIILLKDGKVIGERKGRGR